MKDYSIISRDAESNKSTFKNGSKIVQAPWKTPSSDMTRNKVKQGKI